MKITIQAGENTYLIAGKTTPVDGIGTYQGRLLNELKISRRFSKAGNAPLTLNISIRNNDGFIPRAINLWAAVVTVVTDAGYRWVGKITAYDRDNSDVLNIVATERSAPELSIQFPDEVAGVVTVDENLHQSTLKLTIPLVVGGNADQPILIKGILVNKNLGIYYLCVGEIHQVVKVYRGDKEITAGFSAFTGSAGQANYAGFVYVQITDEALRKNDDGTYSEISAEVIGLKLGSHSIEECRNGARFLQYLLSTPKDGVCGWGLGISSSEINSASFATAISRVDAAGLKMDGVFYFRQIAQSWIDQICQAIRGDYEIGENGQRRLFVNANTASVKTYTKKNIKLLRDGKGSYTGQVYNKGRLEFDYNPLTGIFMQSAQFQDPDCIDDIEEQLFLGQSYLIRDMATAQAILEYTCKKSIVGADKVYFETLELPDDVKKGDIITIDYPEKALTGTWQIFAFDIGDYKHTIEAEKISSDIFVVGSPGVKIDWPIEIPITSTVNPGSASGLSLSSEVRPSPDGSNLVVLKGTFTPPAGGYLAATIEYAQGILPILSWTDLGMLRGNSFEISGVEPGQPYAVRIRMVSANGKSDYITGTLTVQGDDIPPGIPTITVSSYLKTVTIKCVLSPYPSDMAGFEIFRHTSNNSAAAQSIGKVAGAEGVATIQDTETAYGMTYYYFAKAYDTWGNPSGFSAVKSTFITFVQTADLADQILSESRLFAQGVVDAAALSNAALKQAGGAVAAWSAKGCTTASIAEAGGVVDTTGNGNNGQAFGGVAVVNSEMGRAFAFDGINDYIGMGFPFSGATACTLAANVKIDSAVTSLKMVVSLGLPYVGLTTLGRVHFSFTGDGVQRNLYSPVDSVPIGRAFHVIATHDGTTAKIYIDGVEVASGALGAFSTVAAGIFIGNHSNGSYYLAGLATNIRIFSRALSATEAKCLNMFPDDAVFARITADFIGTYELVSRHFASDSVVARMIAAQAVTMEKLLVGAPGAALNDDPGFMDASAWETMDGYSSYSGWQLATVVDGKVGNKVLRGSAGTLLAYDAFVQKRYIPIDLSKTYRLHVIARKRDAATNGSVTLSVREYSNSKSLLSEYAGHYVINAIPGTIWTEFNSTIGPKGTYQFAAGTAFVRIGGLMDNATTAGAGYEIQDYRLEECTPSTLIQEGAILAQHLTVEEAVITRAAQIANLVVGNAHISDLHGSKITAGTLAIAGLESSAQNTINTAYSNAGTALTNAATAQATANNAVSAAATAQTTANNAATAATNAQNSATTANNLLADIAADNKLTPIEKQDTRQEWDIIAAEKLGINSQATTFGVTTENTTYNSAFQALANYLNAGTTWSSGIPSWIADANLGTTTTIVGATFRTNWKTYYDARTALLNAISAKAKTLADAAQTTANAAQTTANTANSTATTALLASSVKQISATQKLFLNVLGYQYNVSSTAGYLIIRTPITASFMCKIRITGYNYAGSTSNLDLTISFYAYTSSILNYSYTSIGNFAPSKVQLCRDANGKIVILLGLSNTAWSYPSVAVPEALISYQLPPDSYKDGWTASISTDLTGLTGLVEVSGLDMQKKTVENAATLATWCWNNNFTYIDGANIYTGTVGTVQLTAEQIYGKDIRSGLNVGESNGAGGYVPGTRMKPTGFEAFNVSGRTFFADNNGNAGIGGFVLTPTDMTAGSGSTAIGISTDTAKKAFWAGHATPASAPFFVEHDGTVKMKDGYLGQYAFDITTYTVGSASYSLTTLAKKVSGTKNTVSLQAWAGQSLSTDANETLLEIIHGGITAAGGGILHPEIQLAASVNGIVRKVHLTALATPHSGTTPQSNTQYIPVAVIVGGATEYGIHTNGKINASGNFTTYSDRSVKRDINDVNALRKLKSIKIASYKLDSAALERKRFEGEIANNLRDKNAVIASFQPSEEYDVEDYRAPKYIGCFAGEFNRAFGVNGESEDTVCLGDQIGVALRAIQELAEIVDDQAAEIAELRAALKLPEKPKKVEEEPIFLTDEEREYIRLAEEATSES